MSDQPERRLPQVFDPSDPRLTASTPDTETANADSLPAAVPARDGLRLPTAADLQRGMRWGVWLVSSALGLIAMSFVLRFWSFVWDLFQRNDWIGWTALALAAVVVVSAVMLIAREVLGLLLLARLQHLRARVEEALAGGKEPAVKSALRQLRALYAQRPELSWPRASLAEHDRAIMTAAERLALFDRTVMAAVDNQAVDAIAQSARRVSVVTAITPFPALDMAFVLYENLRMLRRIGSAYGGRPGYAALFQMAGRVLGHVIATGGLAMTDDLLGQFVGQGLAKRLSARAGQGMFNGGLTARLGIAAITVSRPMPFIEARKPRFRDLALEIGRGMTGGRNEPDVGT